MRDLGKYGNLAAEHMARWQPSTYAAIPAEQREQYFLDLNEEVSQRVRDLGHSLRPPASLSETDWQEYIGQTNMAFLMAEEQVLAELVYLPPEPGLEGEDPEEEPFDPIQDWFRQKEQEAIEEDIEYERERKAAEAEGH